MPGRLRMGALIGIFLLLCFLGSIETFAAKQQTRMIEASAHNPTSGLLEESEEVDRKEIIIEDGYTYVSHSVNIVSSNPRPESEDRWSYDHGVVRGDDGKVRSVWVEVRARNKGILHDAVWVRAQLTVVVEEDEP